VLATVAPRKRQKRAFHRPGFCYIPAGPDPR
jgi:hypothetical protein